MKVIGISAKIGGGKDTAHQVLSNYYSEMGYNCTKLSFAKPLKDICTLLFNWDRQRLEDDFLYKEGDTLDDGTPDPACQMLGKTRRVVMQELGTEAMRDGLHPDIWVIAMKLAISRGEYDNYDYGFLTDCRFINELKFVKDMNGKCIKINRIGDQSTLSTETQHISELEWEQWTDWECIVDNIISPHLSESENKEMFLDNLLRGLG